MSRLKFPVDYKNERMLLSSIIAKDSADGAASVIRAMLVSKGIVLADDNTAGVNADIQEALRIKFAARAENWREQRDLMFEAPWKAYISGNQFLKSFYDPNFKQLTIWGVPVAASGRLIYPPALLERTDLFKPFKTQHDTFPGVTSPMRPYFVLHGIDLVAVALVITNVVTLHNNFTADTETSEAATTQRDILWDPIMKHIHSIGDFLMKLYNDNPKQLGAYGFDVVDDSAKAKERTSRIKILSTKVLSGIVLGSVLTNDGVAPIEVYKGKLGLGTSTLVMPGEQLGMSAGYSSVTIVNKSSLSQAVIKTLTNK